MQPGRGRHRAARQGLVSPDPAAGAGQVLQTPRDCTRYSKKASRCVGAPGLRPTAPTPTTWISPSLFFFGLLGLELLNKSTEAVLWLLASFVHFFSISI